MPKDKLHKEDNLKVHLSFNMKYIVGRKKIEMLVLVI